MQVSVDLVDALTRIAGLFVPILDRLLRSREGKKRRHVRIELELPEGRTTEVQLNLQVRVRIHGEVPRQMQTALGLLRSGRFEEALKAFEMLEMSGVKDASLLNYKSIALYRLRRYHDSLDAAKSAYRIKSNDPAIVVNVATALRKLGRKREAVSWYRRALAIDPAHMPAWFGLGDAYREMGQPSRSLQSYDRAIAIDSSQSDLWNNRALALFDLGEYSRAEESFRRALEIWPNHVHALGNLSKLVAGLCRYQESIDFAEHTLRRDPNQITALHSKAFSLSKLKRYSEAAVAYREVLRRRPGDPAALGHLGALEAVIGDYTSAETHLNAALAAGYDHGRVYVDLASLRIKQGRFREGIELTLRALIHRQPKWVRSIAYTNAALVLAMKRGFSQGAAIARSAIYLNPENGDAWNCLAACLLELGEFQKSEEAIERAIAIEPENQGFRNNKEELMKAKKAGAPVRIAWSRERS